MQGNPYPLVLRDHEVQYPSNYIPLGLSFVDLLGLSLDLRDIRLAEP